MAYANDIDLMAHTTLGLNEAFLNLEKSARNMGLVINQEKTVYMYSGKDTTLHQDPAIGNYVFEWTISNIWVQWSMKLTAGQKK